MNLHRLLPRSVLMSLVGVLAISAVAQAEPMPGARAAAEAGDTRAQFALALMYDTGDGVPTNYPEALKWFRLAAEGGYVVGQAKLGLMYLYGWAVKRDVAEAARWYEKAAAQGHAPAQAQIGQMYASGQGVTKNLVLAWMWTNLSATAGDALSAWRRDRLRNKMTPAEFAEAEALAHQWRPTRALR